MEISTSLDALKSPADQVSTLRAIKNDIVGHDQRKEAFVRAGLLDILASILARSYGKRRSSNGVSTSDSQEAEVKLQAVLVIGSLANGGAAFVAPLQAAGTLELLLDTIEDCTSSRLVTAALQTLKTLSTSDQFAPTSRISWVLLTVLRQPASVQQLRLTAEIIANSTISESARRVFADPSILDTLAALLASYAVASKHVVYHGDTTHLPSPPSEQALPSVLSAICAIVGESNYDVHRFVLSGPIRELFSSSSAQGDQRQFLGPKFGFVDPRGEPLLPLVYVPAYGTTTYYGGSRAFPALASLQPHERRHTAGTDAVPEDGDLDHTNAVCSYLLVLARSMREYNRLIALRLLALVNNAHNSHVTTSGHRSENVQKTRERERQLALLAVPLIVVLVAETKPASAASAVSVEQRDNRLVSESACEVLALLVKYCKDLQVAAVDAGIIKHASLVLKRTFDPVQLAKPMWSLKSAGKDDMSVPATQRMGGRGLPSEILHVMRCRQGALQCLAAIAANEDIHRKAIVDAGVINLVIDALKPYPPDFAEKLVASRSQVGPKDGNTTGVIIAACTMAKTMSRSVSLLRTSLIDAGISKPIIQLLSHPEESVQLAATDVCVNILSEASPMREDMVADGVVKILTVHARSSTPAMRLSSLWALKHLVLNIAKETKITVLEELGIEWLVATIQAEKPTVAPPAHSGGGVGLSTANAAGVQVDLLNPSSMDVDEPSGIDYEDDDEDGEVMYDESSSTHYQASQLRSTISAPPYAAFDTKAYLSSIRELEQNPTLRTKRDDFFVQEQALDLIRNLLNGDDCATMVDYLLNQIGSIKLLGILTDKLKPLQDIPKLHGNRPVYNPVEILMGTIHIINHIANGFPRHKQLIVSQKALLHAWLPHFSSTERRIRIISVWAINSLTWIEDDDDRKDARQRALELRSAGFESVVRNMVNDPDLDVKERVKTSVRQFDLLL